MEYYGALQTGSNGDLWPSCWADDGAIYAANGDGTGFDLSAAEADTVVNRIDGTPAAGIIGERLAAGAQLGPIWGNSSHYNRKPTGMTCVDGVLYLAMQDLKYGTGAFDESPVASISRSTTTAPPGRRPARRCSPTRGSPRCSSSTSARTTGSPRAPSAPATEPTCTATAWTGTGASPIPA